MHDSPLLQAVLPLRSVIITLRWLSASQTGFLHHVGLHAWVRFLTGSPEQFSDFIIVEPIENGHINYQVGDGYKFRVTVLNGGESMLDQLFASLKQLPESAANHPNIAGAFSDNLVLETIEDTFEHHQVTRIEALSVFDINALMLETAVWSRQRRFKVAFNTPARLVKPKPKDGTELKGQNRYCRDKSDLSWQLFTHRLTDTFINLFQSRTGERLQRQNWPEAQLHAGLAVWLNNNYTNKSEKKVKDASGMLAQMQIEIDDDFPADLLALLVLGQYIGIGQNRAFGMGQYQLQDAYGYTSYPRPQATKSLLEKSLSDASLQQACQTMYPRQAHFDSSDTDEEHQDAIDELLSKLHASRERIFQREFTPSQLHPVEIEKPEGGTRLLTVPNWHDRTLQKAVTECLGNTLEHIWMKHSYGYRKGHSRLQARDQINQYIQQGYEWVLESDIESFFDSVNWLNLEQRLKLLLPNEPLVPLLMQWVSAAKQTEDDQTLARHNGLPQGAPISPILANLLLDDLDQDMIAKGHQIVRYADDFVLLFKTKAAAESALKDIITSLEEHHLAINLEKTRIVAASQGFRYLGYLFVDGYAIETKREYRKEHAQLDKQLNASSPENEPSLEQAPSTQQEPSTQNQQSALIGEREKLGTLLIIAGDIAMLSSEKQRLIVEQYDELHTYPWATLSSVLLIGPHHITTPALKSAMFHNVPVHFASQYGRYQGVSAGAAPSVFGADFWLLQAQYLQQETNALAISQALIQARIEGISAVISRREKNAPELNKIKRLDEKRQRAETLDQLRGYEGQASKQLWAFFQRILEQDWGFTGRNRRPPKDPINALLSLGYTYLYSLVDSVNRTIGLYPWQGALHQRHGYHHTLASDLMEPWRYLVERVVLTLINRHQIHKDDFVITENGCEMSSGARKTLLKELLVQLTNVPKEGNSLLTEMSNQAYRLALSCKMQQSFIAWSPKR